MIVLGIDVGTSSVKAAIVDVANGSAIVTSMSVPYPIDQPEPDAAEVRAEALWQAIEQAASSVVGSQGDRVTGIGLSCMTPTLCLLDDADQPLGAFRIHSDRRAREEARAVQQDVGQEFLDTVGTKPLPGGISAVMALSRKRREPALRIRRYLHLNSWLALHLTGQTAFDPGNASFTGLWNTLGDQKWSPRWCEYFGVDASWLSAVVDGATTIGGLRPKVAEQLGLLPGIPVKLGTADTSCGMIAADLKMGELYHSVGTTQVLAALTDRPRPALTRLTRHFGIGQLFMHVAHNPVGGAALAWLRKLCFADMADDQYYAGVIPAAISRPTNVRLDPPYLGGDRLQIDEVTAGFSGVTLNSDRLDLVAAVLHAMTEGHLTARANLGIDRPFHRIALSGGGGDMIRQLLKEYQSAPVAMIHDGAVRGAAKLFALEQS